MMRNESKLFFKLDDVPDNVVRYTGEVDYVHGEWASAKRVIKKTTEGGFAVMSDCGAWHFFNKDENKVEDILPKGLICEARMVPMNRTAP